MASICISIETDQAAQLFDRTLQQASIVAQDMIQVRSDIWGGVLVKIVRTDCPSAFSVLRSALAGYAHHD